MVTGVPNYKEDIIAEKRKKYCLLIPLMNEGMLFFKQVENMKKHDVFKRVDVVICDAGSTDGTTDLTYLKDNGFRALLTRVGTGRYSTDLRMGYYWAIKNQYEGVITVDGNNKDGIEAIDSFIEKLDNGYDYIQGSRFIKGGVHKNTPLIRYLACRLINEPIMTLMSRKHLTDTTNGFRAYSYKFLTDSRVSVFRDVFWGYELIYYLPVRACRLNYKTVEIPVSRCYPNDGTVPTKVGGIRGNIYQLSILWNIILSRYNP